MAADIVPIGKTIVATARYISTLTFAFGNG